METLRILAKAFDSGDDSAFEPLIDCLLENGLVNCARRIWWIARQKDIHGKPQRSCIVDQMARGLPASVIENGGGLNGDDRMCDQKTLERFKGA